MVMSIQKYLAYAPLENAMKESLSRKYGVKIRVFSTVAQMKQMFYNIKKEFPEFEKLSLLSTDSPTDFLIYNPEGDKENG